MSSPDPTSSTAFVKTAKQLPACNLGMNDRPEVRQGQLADRKKIWHALGMGTYWTEAHTKPR